MLRIGPHADISYITNRYEGDGMISLQSCCFSKSCGKDEEGREPLQAVTADAVRLRGVGRAVATCTSSFDVVRYYLTYAPSCVNRGDKAGTYLQLEMSA